jgi:methyl-accepting chemotaxis protein
MSTPAVAGAPVQAQQPPKRLLRNYLLTARFQLKYTLIIVAVALVIAGGLGTWLVVAWDKNVDAAERMVELGREMTTLAQENTKLMLVDAETTADAELARVLKERAALQDARVIGLANAREERAAEIRSNAGRFRVLLFIIMAGLVVVLTVFGIFITHSVAGPLFVMTRQFKKVANGDFAQSSRGLRDHDELKDFYSAYKIMVDSLRERQRADIAVLEHALIELSGKEGVAESALGALRSMMEAKLASLRGTTPSAVNFPAIRG